MPVDGAKPSALMWITLEPDKERSGFLPDLIREVHSAEFRFPSGEGTMSSAAKRVLVVDNSAVVRHSISAMLLRIGCQISEAEDGDEALRLIASQPPDLVILDLYMPNKDGVETLAEIRTNPAHQDLTVFILTRTASPDFVRRAASLGVTDYLVSPS